MADPFIVPRADYSFLSQLPEQFAQGEQLGRESALRSALGKIPLGPNGEQDFGAMMKAFSQYGTPEDVARMSLARQQQQAEQAYRGAQLGLEGARIGAEYPWATQPTPTGVQPTGAQATDVPRPRNKAEYMSDQKYASGDYLTWLQGGFSETEQSLKSLQHAKDLLDKNPDAFGNPAIVGLQVKKSLSGHDDMYTMAARTMYPEAFNVAQAHQRAVVASLRPLVGARAAQQLFQSIMQTTYDPMAKPEENSRRLGLVLENIKNAAKAKQDMAEYFRKNQTLSGYSGPKFDPDTFDPTVGVETQGGTEQSIAPGVTTTTATGLPQTVSPSAGDVPVQGARTETTAPNRLPPDQLRNFLDTETSGTLHLSDGRTVKGIKRDGHWYDADTGERIQ